MRWKVEIKTEGEDRLLRDLIATFEAALLHVDGKEYLSGQLLNACTTAADARATAERVVQSFSEASAHAALGLRMALQNTVVETGADGVTLEHHTMVALSGEFAMALQGAVLVAAGTAGPAPSEEEERQRALEKDECEYQERFQKALIRVRSAFLSPDAVKVQRLLARELTPHAMGLISEVIERQGESARLKLAPRKQVGAI